MKNLKISVLIVLVIICILIISILLFLLKGDINTDGGIVNETPISEQEKKEIFDDINKMNEVTNVADYFYAKEIVDRYMQFVNIIKEDTNQENTSDYKKQLMGVIPDSVKMEMNLKEENIENQLSFPRGSIIIKNIYVSNQTVNSEMYENVTDIRLYYLNVDILDIEQAKKQNKEILVIFDFNNKTFYIIPSEYIKLKKYNISKGENIQIYDKETIGDNGYNKISTQDISEQNICQEYFNLYKLNALYDIEASYNSLDEEYRNVRFGSVENYKKYLQESNLKNIRFEKYQVTYNENVRNYVCMDQYGKYYIFEENNIRMNAKVKLDTYTITSDAYKNAYNNGDSAMKAKLNLDKFRLMINNQDYDNAYKLLDETFRNNNFKTEDDFIKYVKSHMYVYNNIEFTQIEENSGLLLCTAEFKDLTNGEYYKQSNTQVPKDTKWNFVVKLVDENSCVMSFEVK